MKQEIISMKEHNKTYSRKHRKVDRTLNYIEQSFILVSTITECTSISSFPSLLGIPIGITSSEIGLRICAIAAGIKKYKSTIMKKKKKHDLIVLLEKSKLNSIEVLISKALIDSNNSQDKFVLTNNMLKEYGNLKEEIKNLKT